MRIIFFFIATIFMSISGYRLKAQESSNANTLFGNGASLNGKEAGFFVAPALGFTSMDGSAAALFNVRGGVNLKDKVSLGGYFSTSLNDINPESETIPGIYLDYWSVGAFAEYTWQSKKIFHLTFPVFFGFGEVEMDNETGNAGLGEANFFQVEPSAQIEVNLHKYVRLNFGAGYRLVSQMNYRNFNQSDVSGLTGYFGLKFGWFR